MGALNIIVQCLTCLIFLKQLSARVVPNDYEQNRTQILNEERKKSLGGSLLLNAEEAKVNDILMKLKNTEVDEALNNSQIFKYSKHYFAFRNQIKRSKVYNIIKEMPKGAVLHVHNSFMLDEDSLLQLTYEEYLYTCYTEFDLTFHFSQTVPKLPCTAAWTLLSDLRETSRNVKNFDLKLKKRLTIYTEEENFDTNIDVVWEKFDKIYYSVSSLLAYRPVREKYIYASLKRFYEDNILYIELRSGTSGLYELNGTFHNEMFMVKLHQQITNKFTEQFPDFVGIKLIQSAYRGADIDSIRKSLDKARKIKNEVPEMFAGFDLVGQEDRGKPLVDFLPTLLDAKNEINFYFHGGETNWFGTKSDENLVDAILLGSKRIGHAYALSKHPSLMAAVKEKDIALEVNVISNSVLSLVQDLRNHPLAVYLANDLPVVLSSDDPGVWGAEPLSHDFYVVFAAISSKHADIRMLKQLAINSIKYSALDSRGKLKLFQVFNRRWDNFIDNVLSQRMANGAASIHRTEYLDDLTLRRGVDTGQSGHKQTLNGSTVSGHHELIEE